MSIDLFGPGGGQWTLGLMPDGELTCTVGVHADSDSVLKLSAMEFKKLVAGPKDARVRHAVEQLFPMSSILAFEPHVQGNRERVS